MPLPCMRDGAIGKGAMRYPDVCLCYDKYVYKSGPTLPQLDDYCEDLSPRKQEEQKRILDLTKKVSHPSINRTKFFKTEYINRRLQNNNTYSMFSSLNDSVFINNENEEDKLGKASTVLNYSKILEHEPLKSRNNNICIAYRPIYKLTFEKVFQKRSEQVANDVRKGACPKAMDTNSCTRVFSSVTIPQVPVDLRKSVKHTRVKSDSEIFS